MVFSTMPEPSANGQIEPQGHSDRSLSAVALARHGCLSDIPESASDTSSDAAHLSIDTPAAGPFLQMIRDSAHELLQLTGGRSPNPTPSAADDMADDDSQMQNISRISDDIARNLARIFDLKADHEMKDAVFFEPQAIATPAIMHSPGLSRARRPALKSRGSRLVCRECDCTATPKWRPGPHGPATLCNVCGLLYAKRVGILHGLHDG